MMKDRWGLMLWKVIKLLVGLFSHIPSVRGHDTHLAPKISIARRSLPSTALIIGSGHDPGYCATEIQPCLCYTYSITSSSYEMPVLEQIESIEERFRAVFR
jgi:hypothetical protein